MTQASRVFGSRKNTETDTGHVQDLKYSGWQKPYLDAMLEMNPGRLKHRLASAEAAIDCGFENWQIPLTSKPSASAWRMHKTDCWF
jgi:hypothetical protein